MALVSHCKRSANLRDKFYDFTTYYWTGNVRLFSDYYNHVQSVCIRNYSGSYSVRMWENTNQNNSEYRHFLRNAFIAQS